MTEEELLAMLRSGRTREGSLRERKPGSINAREARRVIVAFANSTPPGQEAVLFVGLHDATGEVIGIQDTDKVQQDYRRALDECYPSITVRMHPLEHGGKAVLAIVVPASSRRPHFTGGAYVRVGSTCALASDELFEELILSRTDKAQRLLQFKRDQTIVELRGINYRLGSLKPFSGGGYVEGGDEYKVRAVDGHTVQFLRLSSGVFFNEALDRVSIEFNTQSNRPLINVCAPGR
jgi:hypothetical protein